MPLNVLIFRVDVGVDHFAFLRLTPLPVPPTDIPFPQGLFWADSEQALKPTDDNCYVSRLLFEMLVPAQVIRFPLTFLLLFIYLFCFLTCIAPYR